MTFLNLLAQAQPQFGGGSSTNPYAAFGAIFVLIIAVVLFLYFIISILLPIFVMVCMMRLGRMAASCERQETILKNLQTTMTAQMRQQSNLAQSQPSKQAKRPVQQGGGADALSELAGS